MKNKIIYTIVFLLFSLNAFSQEFKEHYYHYLQLKDTLVAKNQYGNFKKWGNNKFWIKTIKGKNRYEILTFRLYENKLILEKVENYKGNLLNGYYFHQEIPSRVEEGYYKNGKKHGFWSFSDDMGLQQKGYYKNDKRDGEWKEIFSGTISKGHFKNDLKEGIWTWEDENLFEINEKGEKVKFIVKTYYKEGKEVTPHEGSVR